MRTIKVLNKGYVRLVDSMGDDMSIVRSARVSYNAEPREDGSDKKLIHYLMRNHHTSPFESVELQFEVKAPIFVFRQWHRHRTWGYNEVSARYTALPNDWYVPENSQVTMQSKDNKQMRTEEIHERCDEISWIIDNVSQQAHDHYKQLLDAGCPRELARSILPMGTYSKMYAKVDLHNLFNFLRLRLHEHAQFEIRVYAKAMLSFALEVAPIATTAFLETLDVGS